MKKKITIICGKMKVKYTIQIICGKTMKIGKEEKLKLKGKLKGKEKLKGKLKGKLKEKELAVLKYKIYLLLL